MKIAIQWPRLGPYHLARLRAAHAHAVANGGSVVALETTGRDATYAWSQETSPEPFERVTALPDAIYNEVVPTVMARAVGAEWDHIRPDVVAVNSYSTPDAHAALAWARRQRRVAICMTDSKADDAPRTLMREWIKRCLVGACDAALAGGSPQADYLAQLGFPRAFIFRPYDVVDHEAFATGAERARVEGSASDGLRGLGDPTPFFLVSCRFVADARTVLFGIHARRSRSDV